MPVRKIKPGYCNLTARVPSKKVGRMIDAESSLERDFIFLLEHDQNVTSFEEQPISIKFGNQVYTPDVMVTYSDGQVFIYEVKYRSELEKNWTKLKPKFSAALAYCKANKMKFKLVTDQEIRTPLLQNIEFLSHFARTLSPIESSVNKVLLDTLISFQSSSPRELLTAAFSCNNKRAEAAPILWRMIFNGDFVTNLEVPLSMHSTLSVSEELLESL